MSSTITDALRGIAACNTLSSRPDRWLPCTPQPSRDQIQAAALGVHQAAGTAGQGDDSGH